MGCARRRHLAGAIRLALALASAPACPAFAQLVQDETVESGGTLEQLESEVGRARSYGRLLQVQLRGTSDFIPSSSFDGFDADVYRPSGRLKLTLPVTPDFALRMVVRGQSSIFDFDSVDSDLFGTPSQGRPFHDLNAGSVELQWAWRTPWSGLFAEGEQWSLVGEGAARADWERGSSFGQSVRGGGALGVGYQYSDRLEVIFGVAVGSRLAQGGISASPIYEIDWRFADRWRLNLRGLRGEIEYKLSERLAAFVNGRLDSRSYLLEDRGPGIGKGVLRHRFAPVGLGLRVDAEYVKLSFTAGAVVYQQLQAMDDDRQTLGKTTSRPGPFFEVSVTPRLGTIFGISRASAQQAKAGAQRPGGDSSSTSISTSR
jgi:hypothetical protein